MPDVTNIGPAGIRRRRTWGLIALALAVALVASARVGRWPAYICLATFPFYWAGFLGLLQAREKT
jgi:hypothetical protein